MRGRLVAVGIGFASLLAIGGGAVMQGCYSAPEPQCGFLCGSNPPCPEDYQSLMIPSADGSSMVCRCVLPGVTAQMCFLTDAGGIDQPIVVDTPMNEGIPIIDGELPDVSPDVTVLIDVPEIPDAMIDAAVTPDAEIDAAVMPDAAVDAAMMPDAALDAAVLPDAAPDAPPDAAVDAAISPDAADDAAIPAD